MNIIIETRCIIICNVQCHCFLACLAVTNFTFVHCVYSVPPPVHHGSKVHRLAVATDVHTGLSSGTEAVSGTEDVAAGVGE